MQNQLIRKNEIIKALLKTQTSILKIVSKPSVEEEKEEKEVSPTRNEIIGEYNGRNHYLIKRTKTSLTTYALEILVLIPNLMIFMNYLA